MAHDYLVLFGVMNDLGHGRIEDLYVSGGVPQLTPSPKLFRRIRLGHVDQLAPRTDHRNRRPHAQHEKLLAYCQQIREDVIRRVEVADGLPVHWDST